MLYIYKNTTKKMNEGGETIEESKVAPQESAQIQSQPEQELFKTSNIPQSDKLKEYLQGKMSYKYNKYCIDCKRAQTTHFLLYMGSYVCESCAKEHVKIFGGNSNVYVKDVLNEHWDDYQLKSLCLGGNEPLFELLREYQLENESDISKKYKSAAAQWYKRKHLADMDDIAFDQAKPPKDWNERMEGVKQGLSTTGQVIGSNLQTFGQAAKVHGGAAAVKVGETASELK